MSNTVYQSSNNGKCANCGQWITDHDHRKISLPCPKLWDDTYTGPRYTYGLSYRPLGTAQVPSDWILQSDRKSPAFAFGTVDYPRQLTDHEISQFSLTKVETGI